MDSKWMSYALSLAKQASQVSEVPVGAIVVKNNEIIGQGFNLRESSQDPTAHAEIIAIREAAKYLQSWRLVGCELYVTLEPCIMCSGAIIQSRIERVIYATDDPKGGACHSLYDLSSDTRLNHQFTVTKGILQNESSELLKSFFRELRCSSRKSPR